MFAKDVKKTYYIKFTKSYSNTSLGKIKAGDILYVDALVEYQSKSSVNKTFKLIKVKKDGTPKSIAVKGNTVIITSVNLDKAIHNKIAKVSPSFIEFQVMTLDEKYFIDMLTYLGVFRLSSLPLKEILKNQGNWIYIYLDKDETIRNLTRSKILKALEIKNIKYEGTYGTFIKILKNQ